MTRTRTGLAALAALCLGAGGVAAEDSPVVIELYTSQGCSSCPPADEFLEDLAKRDDVLPLALHVDYWDYIGWRDQFGQSAFTRRQEAYARAFGERMVYTPQMIVNGTHHTIGNRPMEVMDLVMAHMEQPQIVALTLTREGDSIHVAAHLSAAGQGSATGPYVVELVRYMPRARVAIENGENAGRTIDYVNIVTEWRPVAEWDPAAPLNMSIDVAGEAETAVLIQSPGPGAIVAAGRVD